MRQRRLLIGWLQGGLILLFVCLTMMLAGFVAASTHYPTGAADPDNAAPSGNAAFTDAQAPASTIPDKTAVITFEGGPEENATGRIVNLLAAEKVAATFFLSGSGALVQPELVRSITAAGNEVGLSSFTYASLSRQSALRTKFDLAMSEAAIVDATGKVPSLIRPYGPSAESIGTEIRPGTGGLDGYIVVPTGNQPADWSFPGTWQLTQDATPVGNEGVIVTLPATASSADSTLDALPSIIAMFRARGYSFDTVSSALGLPAQSSMRPATAQEIAVAAVTAWTLRTSALLVSVLGWVLLPLGMLTVLRVILVSGLAWVQARRERRTTDDVSGDGPYLGPVSIIVPAYNEEANIAATLRSLLASDYPEFEIIAVDDGSTDRTLSILAEFGARIVHVRQSNSGKPNALNNGIAHASHPVIVMVDGDTVFEPGTLRELVARMSDPAVGAIAGNTKVVNRQGILGRWQHVEYVVGMNLDRRVFEMLDCMPTVPGAIGAFRRAAVLAVGGVPTRTLAEDTDLAMAINLAGYRVVYAGRAVAWTEAPSSAKALMRQRYRWCYGTMQAMWFHRRAVRPVRPGTIGHVGSRGVPYLVMFQVAQPLIAPIIDAYLLYALFFIDVRRVVLIWLAFTVLQTASAWLALRLDGESARCLWVVPTTQIFYRQLLYVVVIQSVASVVCGSVLRWHQPPRTGAVSQRMTDRENALQPGQGLAGS